jgi:hypothetical protein
MTLVLRCARRTSCFGSCLLLPVPLPSASVSPGPRWRSRARAQITGFLGAGKTTLVNSILQGDHGLKIAVIENEVRAAPRQSGRRAAAAHLRRRCVRPHHALAVALARPRAVWGGEHRRCAGC